MEVIVVHDEIENRPADALIVGLFEGSQPEGATQTVNEALGGAVSELIEAGDLNGKAGNVAVLYPRAAIPAQRVVVVGLGPREDLDLEALRRWAAHGIRKARDLKARSVAAALYSTASGDSTQAAAQAMAEGCLLTLYDYRGQKTKESPEVSPESLELVIAPEQDKVGAQNGVQAGQAIAAGVVLTRDLVNLPPNICTPGYLAETAKQTAKAVGLQVEILGQEQMTELGMGALLAVAQGSDAPPSFTVLEHNASRADELDTLVLVGKGVTFDTGGYSLKTKDSMATMKGDMAGAAAVIGAMHAIGVLEVPLHVVGLVPAADNMISGRAYRPQEVVTASNGVTIEIISTDAEGRMLLADALVYAARYNPAAVVDIATLTGTCASALGGIAAGLFSTDDRLRDSLLAAAKATAEKVWPLPLFSEYERAIESNTADIKNSGGWRGGIGASAMFLKHFVDYPAWAHIDMAGMSFEAKDIPYIPDKHATGFGVRLLTEFVRNWA